MKKSKKTFGIKTYSTVALPHLESILDQNLKVLESIVDRVVSNVQAGRSLFIFGSGHSALLPLEVYHRAGGPSFVIPLVADYLLPTAGPPVVRILERTPGIATVLLNRAQPKPGEMVWIISQSGINGAVVDFALEARRRKLHTVAFTSLNHSRSVPSRHPSQKKLFQVCHEVVDLCGAVGDAAVTINPTLSVGPLSSLSGVFLFHSILTSATGRLEQAGVHCVYQSVNTIQGEIRNRKIEKIAQLRDPLLR